MRSQLNLVLASLQVLVTLSSSSDVISGLVRVASCRASLTQVPGSWDLCADLAPASVASICVRPGLARDRGLASVCRHYYQTNMTPAHSGDLTSAPGLPWHFPSGLHVSGCSVTWPHLAPPTNSLQGAGAGRRAVYLVLGQDRAGQWYEVTQTRASEARLQPQMAAKLARLVVLGVRGDSGVQDSLSRDMEAVTSCRPRETTPGVTFTEDRDLAPRVTSVQAFGDSGLADVVLKWRGPHVQIVQEAAYMIQWQRLPGSITGNLVTSDVSASLTLEAGSLYLVTVTDMARGTISPPTAVNTNNHRATAATTEEQQQSPSAGLILGVLSLITLIIVCVISVGIWIRRKFLSEKLDETCLKNEQIVARNNIFSKTVTKARTIFIQSSLLSENLEDLKCFVPFIPGQKQPGNIPCQQ